MLVAPGRLSQLTPRSAYHLFFHYLTCILRCHVHLRSSFRWENRRGVCDDSGVTGIGVLAAGIPRDGYKQ